MVFIHHPLSSATPVPVSAKRMLAREKSKPNQRTDPSKNQRRHCGPMENKSRIHERVKNA